MFSTFVFVSLSGTRGSHTMVVVLDEGGMADVPLPIVVQEYCNHQELLFKARLTFVCVGTQLRRGSVGGTVQSVMPWSGVRQTIERGGQRKVERWTNVLHAPARTKNAHQPHHHKTLSFAEYGLALSMELRTSRDYFFLYSPIDVEHTIRHPSPQPGSLMVSNIF